MNKKIILSIVVLFLYVQNSFSYEAEVRNISSRDYYPAVKELIDNAQESIYMSMFVVALYEKSKNSMVTKLCNALADASKRGVYVKIILDKNINFYAKDDGNPFEGKNKKAFKFFKEHGIEVVYDDERIYSHSKVLVIDKKIVVLGSTNWSQTSINKNNETSAVIVSEDFAESVLEDFSKIKLSK